MLPTISQRERRPRYREAERPLQLIDARRICHHPDTPAEPICHCQRRKSQPIFPTNLSPTRTTCIPRRSLFYSAERPPRPPHSPHTLLIRGIRKLPPRPPLALNAHTLRISSHAALDPESSPNTSLQPHRMPRRYAPETNGCIRARGLCHGQSTVALGFIDPLDIGFRRRIIECSCRVSVRWTGYTMDQRNTPCWF